MKYETCAFNLLFSKVVGSNEIITKKYVISILDVYYGKSSHLLEDIINTHKFDKVSVDIEINDKYLYAGRHLVKDVQRLLDSTATLIQEGDYSPEEFYEVSKLFGHSLLWFIDKHKELPPENTEVILVKGYPNTTKNLMNVHSAKMAIGKRLLTDDKIFGFLPDNIFRYIDFMDLATREMWNYGWESVQGAFYRLGDKEENTIYKYEVVRFSDNGAERVTDTFINSSYEDLMEEVKSEVFTVTDDTYAKLSVKKNKPYFVPMWYTKFGEMKEVNK